jgi:hypothetical protein
MLKPPHPPTPSPPEEEKGSKNIKCRNQFAIVVASKEGELKGTILYPLLLAASSRANHTSLSLPLLAVRSRAKHTNPSPLLLAARRRGDGYVHGTACAKRAAPVIAPIAFNKTVVEFIDTQHFESFIS